jgi:hypothetical protein
MADEVQIKFGADIGGAISAINTLKQAVSSVAEPVSRLKTAFADVGAAAQLNSAVALAAFRADMQRMVAERAISLRQALGFDLEYAARRSEQERAHFERVLASDAATIAEKSESYGELVALSARYEAQLAQDQRRLAEAARYEADRMAQPYRQAFDAIGAGWRSVVIGLVEGTLNFRTAALGVAQSVERGFISMAQTTLSRAAAGPLASLLGVAGPAAGEGVGDVLGNAASRFIFGAPQQLGEAAVSTANIAALATNTAALGALTASLGASAAVGGAGALGGLGSAAAVAGGTAGSAAGGFSLLGFLGSLFAFKGGGIVPSAARGWALPNFPGTTPALLHAREMVLPAPISEGLQRMIGDGGPNGAGGADMHLHFHGPSDGPAVERWFTGLMARNPGVVRNMLRSNALTPRTI